ncbi:FadR family transcriptional regulator [Hyphomicrobiales bacterium]|nr:FadR family transcriptional regulator [Chelatococcus sp. HY11]CAH1656902.1 FadR family transcriptional regulator [Hyphomicrobiales bacterium]CAH1695928.1 FadR family transcriptional regulator [Hyphomicrobiales bacterium]
MMIQAPATSCTIAWLKPGEGETEVARAPFEAVKLVRPKRLYEQIASQIEQMIRAEELPAGSRLPGERELADTLGVSRPSLREALIALETAGLIEVRGGGGTFVRPAQASVGIFSFTGEMDLGPGTLEQFEARRAIEPACAELAASYATPEQISALEASLRRMARIIRAGRNPSAEHQAFHLLVAEASRNSILASAVRELWRLRQEPMWSILRLRVENRESYELGLQFRRQLIDCLKRHDGAAARRAVEEHFMRLDEMYFDRKV